MKKPKFTDEFRYRHGYTRSNETDITGTFRRIRRELQEKPKAPVIATIPERRKA